MQAAVAFDQQDALTAFLTIFIIIFIIVALILTLMTMAPPFMSQGKD